MTRYLYKAKESKDSKFWHVGAYYKFLPYTPNPCSNVLPETDYKHLIISHTFSDWGLPRELKATEIDVETLCQFTGHNDKNGTPIWEYDIMRRHDGANCYTYGEVHWNPQLCRFILAKDDGDYVNFPLVDWEIVGSKYDRKV